MPTTPLFCSQLFQNFDDLKSAVEDWSIADKFRFWIHLKDKDRADYGCKCSVFRPVRTVQNDLICQYIVFPSRTRADDIRNSCLISLHNCLEAAIPIRSTWNNQSWLTWRILKYLVVSTIRKTTPRELTDTIQPYYNEDINYLVTYKACSKLNNNTIEYEHDSYRQIPDYLALVQAANPWAYLLLDTILSAEIDPLSAEQLSQFRCNFIFPAETQLSFQ